MTLVGLTQSFENGVARFQDNLVENINRGDENYLALLDAADATSKATAWTCLKNPKPAHAWPTQPA